MYYSLSKTLKVSRRYLLPRAWMYIFLIWNLDGYSASKVIDNSSSKTSHPHSSSLANNASSSSPYAEPSPHFSTLLHKINLHKHEPHVIAQLVQSGTANLHKLLQNLQKITSHRGRVSGKSAPLNPYNNATASLAQYAGTKVMSGKLLGVNKIAASIPSYITNNTRLKRQLEGIFHVRGTPSTTSTIPTTTKRPSNAPYNVTASNTNPLNNLPSRKLRVRPQNGSLFGGGGGLVKRIRKVGHGRENVNNGTNNWTPPSPQAVDVGSSPQKEIGQVTHHKDKEDKKISTITNFHSKKSSNSNNINKDADAELAELGDVPQDLNGKRNYSVEIVEIARKTVIKEDNNDSGKYRPTFRPLSFLPKKDLVDKSGSNNQDNSPATNSKSSFRPSFRPRVKTGNFFKSGKTPVTLSSPRYPQDSTSTEPLIKKPSTNNIFKPSVKYKSATSNHDLITSSTTARPISIVERSDSPQVHFQPISSTIPKRKTHNQGTVEVKVSYQDQIPYNDRDVDEADLKDYLDGHSTFGAKGDFKHVVSKNVTGYLPNSQDNTKAVKHGVSKRQPSLAQLSPVPQRRSRSRETSNNEVEVEVARVKEHSPIVNSNQRNNKATVYTATGVPVLDMEDKAIYQYSGNKDKPHHFPKLPKSTLDALYKQGHPAIAKAPVQVADDAPEDYNPFRANPLVDDIPLKYDLQSDTFYGDPYPDKEKLAQSNRPEPNRVQIETDMAPEYQEAEKKEPPPPPPPTSFSRRSSNGNGEVQGNNRDNRDNQNEPEKAYYERVYEPPDEFANERAVENDADGFIKDFVSLDNNFQQLPRPTKDEESFRDLIAPEARDNGDDEYFEPDGARGRSRGRDRERTSTGRSTRDEDGERNSRDKEEEEEIEDGGGYEPVLENEEEFGPTGPTEDFDKSYVDALKQFDDEIKQIQDNERNGISTTGNPSPHSHPPPTSTGEPLVITSPGPMVSYQQRNAPPPPMHRHQVTTPTHQRQEPEEPEQEEEEAEVEEEGQNQRSDPSRGRDRDQDRDRGQSRESDDDRGRDEEPEGQRRGGSKEEEQEQEEEPAEEEQENDKNTTTPKKDDKEEEEAEEEETEEDDKNKDESQQVKIKKVVEVKTDGTPARDDKSGNLDEDISKIEEEWRRPRPTLLI